MSIKKKVLGFPFKVLRLAGLFILIYASMVFYLAFTERQLAYPRAVVDVEARALIDSLVEKKQCILPDGTILNGWVMGARADRAILYFPDTEEDAALFLAEVQPLDEQVITFNYRGSAGNKGKPSEKTFESDASFILECATQVHKRPILIGRGTGAILASQLAGSKDTLILIDPTPSIKASISEKYRLLYPSFLIRNKTELKNLIGLDSSYILILQDRKYKVSLQEEVSQKFPAIKNISRDGKTLKETLQLILFF